MTKLSYAGVPLLQQDANGDFQRFLDQYQRIEETPFFGTEPFAVTSPDNITKGTTYGGVGLPILNWSAPPVPRINHLSFPSTGASRWAEGWFVTNDPAIFQVSGTGPNNLVFGDDNNDRTLSVPLYMLPVRQITAVSPPAYLVVLVDQRYFWQFKNTGNLSLTSSSSWSDAFAAIASAVGASITASTVSADYLQPDWVELGRDYESIPLLLDAVASSCGQRICANYDGSIFSCNAGERSPSSLNQPTNIIAGGYQQLLSRQCPSSIRTTFPKCANYVGYCDGSTYSATGSTGGSVTAEHAIHSSCFANYTSGSGTPDNASNLTTLATRIATDWGEWRNSYGYDFTIAGTFAWQSTPYGDRVEWYFGTSTSPDLARQAYTRAISLPYDFGFELQLSQDGSLYPSNTTWTQLDHFQVGKIISPITLGSSGDVEVYSLTGSDLGISVNALDWLQNADPTTNIYPANALVFLHWDCPSNKWAFEAASVGTDKTSIVKITDGSTGSRVSVNSDCIWGGKLQTMPISISALCTSQWVDGADVWIFSMDLGGTVGDGADDSATTPQVISGDRYHARKVGSYYYSGSTRDLYVIRDSLPASARYIRFSLYATLADTDASQANCNVLDSWNGPYPGSTVTVYNLLTVTGSSYYCFTGPTASQGYAVYNELDGKYYIIFMNPTNGLDRMIRITDGSGNTMVGPNGSCVWGGEVMTAAASFTTLCDTSVYADVNTCWVFAIDSQYSDGSTSPAPQLRSGDRYIGFFVGRFNYSGDTRDLYAIRSGLTASARFVKFSLPSDMDNTTPSKSACPVIAYWDGPDPGTTITVYNPVTTTGGIYCFDGLSGATGLAIWDDLAQTYKMWFLQPQAMWIEGALSAALTSGSGTVTTLGASFQGQAPTTPITVYDANHFINAPIGAYCRAVWDDVDKLYKLTNCQTKADWVFGQLYTNLTSSTATVTVNYYWGGHGTLNPGTTITGNNLSSGLMAGVIGDYCLLSYDSRIDQYYFVAVFCEGSG